MFRRIGIPEKVLEVITGKKKCGKCGRFVKEGFFRQNGVVCMQCSKSFKKGMVKK